MKKAVITILIVAVLAGIGVFFYVFHKPHRDVAAEEASLQETASSLVEAFSQDMEAANANYLEQVVEVSGVVAEADAEHVLLEGGVYCALIQDEEQAEVSVGSNVSIKGRVVSFDELFGEVRLDFCQVVQ